MIQLQKAKVLRYLAESCDCSTYTKFNMETIEDAVNWAAVCGPAYVHVAADLSSIWAHSEWPQKETTRNQAAEANAFLDRNKVSDLLLQVMHRMVNSGEFILEDNVADDEYHQEYNRCLAKAAEKYINERIYQRYSCLKSKDCCRKECIGCGSYEQVYVGPCYDVDDCVKCQYYDICKKAKCDRCISHSCYGCGYEKLTGNPIQPKGMDLI